MKKIVKLIKPNEGSILIMVLITFLVLSILTTSVIYINNTNTRQTVAQVENMQAYYLAYSGIEIGYAALMTGTTAFKDDFENTANKTESSTINYGEGNKDTIEITIKSSSDKKTITIISVGTSVKSGKSKKITMSFPVDSPTLKKWK